MEYRVTKMLEQEIDAAVSFHNKYLGKREFIDREEIERRLQSKSGIFFTAKDTEGRIIGIKLGYIDNDVCIGRGIAIEKEFRRLGIGRSLVERFEEELENFPQVKKYVFASSTEEGIPFHISLGYKATLLLQSKDKEALDELNLDSFKVTQNSYNRDFDVYQLYLEPKEELNREYLLKLRSLSPKIGVQFLYEKTLSY